MHITELTPEQIDIIAPLAGTTKGSLRHVVAGRRGMSAEMAIAVELAAAKFGLVLTREEHNAGCAVCEFAKSCRNEQRKGKKK